MAIGKELLSDIGLNRDQFEQILNIMFDHKISPCRAQHTLSIKQDDVIGLNQLL